MEELARLLEGIATLLWPVAVVIFFYTFRQAITSIVESAKARGFTLKLAGQELTMEEASQQQQSLINDLQAEVIELKRKVVSLSDQEIVKKSTAHWSWIV